MPPARSPRTERTLAALRVVFLAHGAHVQEYAALRVLEYNFFGEGRWTTLAQSMRLERVRAMAALGNVIGQGRPGRVEALLRKVEQERIWATRTWRANTWRTMSGIRLPSRRPPRARRCMS